MFGLDLLRMLAILLVVFFHSYTLIPTSIHPFFDFFYFDGVCIFFVLSGFLIGGIIINSVEKKGFSRSELFIFWTRRWFRTLPNYYLFLFIMALLYKLFIKGFSLRIVFPYLFFCQNLFTDMKVSFFGETWSLSVEEWFYITIPLIIFISVNFLKIKFRKSIIFLSAFILLFSVFIRYCMYTGHFPQTIDYTRVVTMRMDNLMYGFIGAYISYYYKSFWIRNKFKLFILGIFLLLSWKVLYYQFPTMEGFFYSNIFFPLFCTGILALLPILSEYKIEKYNKITTAVTYISLISYSLYLIHYSLVKKLLIDTLFFNSYDENSTVILILKNMFYWVVSIVGALIVYKYFEIPTTKLRDKIKFK